MRNKNAPQTRHKVKRIEPENGGILRLTAEASFVAKIALLSDLFP
jgi:hypothetical protein